MSDPVRHALRRRTRRARRQERGQALALGCLSLIIIALMLMLSFNLSQTLHEKVRLQQESDALAFSMATVEARAFNYFAYSNRAMAASYVAMTSLHAYMAAASVTRQMLKAAQYNFYIIAAEEFAQCVSCCPFCCIQHCIHGVQAIVVAQDFSSKADDYAQKVSDVDDSFEQAVTNLNRMVNMIHLSQQDVLLSTSQVLTQGLQGLHDNNAPKSSNLLMQVGLLNVDKMACAIEGVVVPPCIGSSSGLPQSNRSKVMTSVANATRPSWPANRMGIPFPIWLNPQFLDDLMNQIQGNGISVPFMHQGTAKVVDSADTSKLHDGQDGEEGKDVGADEHGWLFSQWNDGASVLPYASALGLDAYVFSDSNNGSHNPSEAHTGQHSGFDGVQSQNTCIMSGDCFINFRSNSEAKSDFGQPPVYSYLTQDTRLDPNGNKGPWEINQSGTVSIENGGNGTATLQLVPGANAVALSKAMVYYHRLGDWHEHPNLFNPFWRAKLHPFKTGEASEILTLAGNMSAADQALLAPEGN